MKITKAPTKNYVQQRILDCKKQQLQVPYLLQLRRPSVTEVMQRLVEKIGETLKQRSTNDPYCGLRSCIVYSLWKGFKLMKNYELEENSIGMIIEDGRLHSPG